MTRARRGLSSVALALLATLVLALGTGCPALEEEPLREGGDTLPETPVPFPTGGPRGVAVGSPAATLEATLREWRVTGNEHSMPAGQITFRVRNEGTVPHNFRVIRFDGDPDALPRANGQVDESQLQVVAGLPDLAPKQRGEFAVGLQPGGYVLICNVPTHYDAGMRTDLTVRHRDGSAPTN